MDGKTPEAGQGGSSRTAERTSRRQRSWEVDVQRALRGDALEELTQSQREWVWRSLLRGVRLSQATKLAQLGPEETPLALQQVVNCYSALMDHRRGEWLAQRDTQLLTGASRATHGNQLDGGTPG
jgi:hypothetical protein